MKERRKIDTTKTTESALNALLAQGWEAVGTMTDKEVGEGDKKKVIKKSHILILEREAVADAGDDDVMLTPAKVTAIIGQKK